jgi:hypothetical protein
MVRKVDRPTCVKFRCRYFVVVVVIVIIIIIIIIIIIGGGGDRLCGLVVRVPGYRFRSPGFDPGVTRFSEK